MAYLETVAAQLGIATWLITVILIWSLAWKLWALWKSARKTHLMWFIVLGLVNTAGILEILYIFVFSKFKSKPLIKPTKARKPVKKKKK